MRVLLRFVGYLGNLRPKWFLTSISHLNVGLYWIAHTCIHMYMCVYLPVCLAKAHCFSHSWWHCSKILQAHAHLITCMYLCRLNVLYAFFILHLPKPIQVLAMFGLSLLSSSVKTSLFVFLLIAWLYAGLLWKSAGNLYR